MKTLLVLLAVVLLAGCSTLRFEENSDMLGGDGPKWGLLSYRKPREQSDARKMMEQYCAPAGFKIVSLERQAIGANTSVQRGFGPPSLQTTYANRTYIKFECTP